MQVCRKRKEKCDGKLPCGHCRMRNKNHDCQYTPACPSSNGSNRNVSIEPQTGLSPPQFHLPEASAFGDSTYSEVDALFGFAAHPEQPAERTIVDSAPIPKQSRMLPDAKGKLSKL